MSIDKYQTMRLWDERDAAFAFEIDALARWRRYYERVQYPSGEQEQNHPGEFLSDADSFSFRHKIYRGIVIFQRNIKIEDNYHIERGETIPV